MLVVSERKRCQVIATYRFRFSSSLQNCGKWCREVRRIARILGHHTACSCLSVCRAQSAKHEQHALEESGDEMNRMLIVIVLAPTLATVAKRTE